MEDFCEKFQFYLRYKNSRNPYRNVDGHYTFLNKKKIVYFVRDLEN